MARSPRNESGDRAGGATLGYEAELWQMADALRGSMDASEFEHVSFGLLHLKYISDAFEERLAALGAEKAQGADPEDPDEYRHDQQHKGRRPVQPSQGRARPRLQIRSLGVRQRAVQEGRRVLHAPLRGQTPRGVMAVRHSADGKRQFCLGAASRSSVGLHRDLGEPSHAQI